MAQFNDALQRVGDALQRGAASLRSDPALGVGILGLVCLVLLLLLLIEGRRIGRLNRRLDRLAGAAAGGSPGAVFEPDPDVVRRLGRDVDGLAARGAMLESNARAHLRGLGLVRFNAFEDTGGNLSFALALLDEAGDGLVLSSLQSRAGSRLYAKAVRGGRSDMALSSEENEAVEQARRGRPPEAVVASSGSRGSVGADGRGGGPPAPGGRFQARPAGRTPAAAEDPAAGVPWQARPAAPSAPSPAPRVDAPNDAMDAGFLERRLRGQNAGQDEGARPLWEDSSGS